MSVYEQYGHRKRLQIGWCPICNQGWQIIMKTADGTLAVCCEECMSAWPSPEDINDPAKATFDEFGLEGMPTHQEILEQGWDKFLTTEN